MKDVIGSREIQTRSTCLGCNHEDRKSVVILELVHHRLTLTDTVIAGEKQHPASKLITQVIFQY